MAGWVQFEGHGIFTFTSFSSVLLTLRGGISNIQIPIPVELLRLLTPTVGIARFRWTCSS
jgi:hypothetical protein